LQTQESGKSGLKTEPTTPYGTRHDQLAGLFRALSLPVDGFSKSLLSMARFFSLPFDKELLAKVRRQALSFELPAEKTANAPLNRQEGVSGETSGKQTAFQHALSLAALAASGKGVRLTDDGLKAYARALSPLNWEEKEKSGGNSNNQNETSRGASGQEQNFDQGGSWENFAQWGQNLEQATLLEIMNSLPVKDKRWIIFPFTTTQNGDEYRICLRILLDGTTLPASEGTGTMALEILKINRTEKNSPENDHWLFVLSNREQRLRVFADQSSLKKNKKTLPSALSQIMNIKPDNIDICGFDGPFPFEEENSGELLLYIDKEV
jgi:hypothetical protein